MYKEQQRRDRLYLERRVERERANPRVFKYINITPTTKRHFIKYKNLHNLEVDQRLL